MEINGASAIKNILSLHALDMHQFPERAKELMKIERQYAEMLKNQSEEALVHAWCKLALIVGASTVFSLMLIVGAFL